QVRNAAEEFYQHGWPFPRWRAEPVVKKLEQEVAVKRGRAAWFHRSSMEPRSEGFAVAVEEPLALNEVKEHQPIEHERGIPFAVARVGDAGDALQQRGAVVVGFPVEALGDPLEIEGGWCACGFGSRSHSATGGLENRVRSPDTTSLRAEGW